MLNKLKAFFTKKPEQEEAKDKRIRYNTGGLLDIPTGSYVRGARGESILLGGMATLVAIAGYANMGKSMLMHFLLLRASRVLSYSGLLPYINYYDTEGTMDVDRIDTLAAHYVRIYRDLKLSELGAVFVTSMVEMLGNKWFKTLKEYLLSEKVKGAKDYTVKTPILDKDGNQVEVIAPTFGGCDSVTEMKTDDVEKIATEHEIGESGGNIINMRMGLAKSRLISELQRVALMSSHFTVITAHMGADAPIQSGPVVKQPQKKLPHMKAGEKPKSTSDKFVYLPMQVWQILSSNALLNSDRTGPLYPKDREDKEANPEDLQEITVCLVRNKYGASGRRIPMVLSQSEGILPTLSEYHYIKEAKYGFEGNATTFNLVLYPQVKFGRTTVRALADNDEKFQRAVKITADLCQMIECYPDLELEIPPITEFYKKLEAEYGWDTLLATRDFMTFDQYENEVPYCSTMCMLRMYHGLYTPYWWKGSSKTNAAEVSK